MADQLKKLVKAVYNSPKTESESAPKTKVTPKEEKLKKFTDNLGIYQVGAI